METNPHTFGRLMVRYAAVVDQPWWHRLGNYVLGHACLWLARRGAFFDMSDQVDFGRHARAMRRVIRLTLHNRRNGGKRRS